MKISFESSVDESWVDSELVSSDEVTIRTVATHQAETHHQNETHKAATHQPEIRQVEIGHSERYGAETHQDETCEMPISLPDFIEVPSDEQFIGQSEIVSEYYTASSEVSLLSDFDDRCQDDLVSKEEMGGRVMAGHVAAMRERFESMTRANTPCPDLARSCSPSLEVFRITPSPDKIE